MYELVLTLTQTQTHRHTQTQQRSDCDGTIKSTVIIITVGEVTHYCLVLVTYRIAPLNGRLIVQCALYKRLCELLRALRRQHTTYSTRRKPHDVSLSISQHLFARASATGLCASWSRCTPSPEHCATEPMSKKDTCGPARSATLESSAGSFLLRSSAPWKPQGSDSRVSMIVGGASSTTLGGESLSSSPGPAVLVRMSLMSVALACAIWCGDTLKCTLRLAGCGAGGGR